VASSALGAIQEEADERDSIMQKSNYHSTRPDETLGKSALQQLDYINLTGGSSKAEKL
jgi:hypothetical protein